MPKPDPNRWDSHYSTLTQNDRDSPLGSLQEICSRASLFSQRDTLFEFYRAATQSEAWEEHDPTHKSDMLFFYSTTLYLWEIAYRIDEMVQLGQLCYSYSLQTNRTEGAEPIGLISDPKWQCRLELVKDTMLTYILTTFHLGRK